MYKGGQKTLITDNFFIMTNIRVNEQMGASGFEGLLCKILSEKPFKDEIIHISNDYKEGTTWSVPEYITHFFGMEILDSFTCLSCDMKKSPKVTVDYNPIFSFDGILPNNKNVKIYHTKYHKLGNMCNIE